MKNIVRLKWIAAFDMENLTGSLLRNGTLVSIGLILVSLGIGWNERAQGTLHLELKAENIPALILTDLQKMNLPGFWSQFLLHLGVSTLLLTPYLRVLASLVYFAGVDRSWKQVIFTGTVLIILTILLLTTLV